MTTEYSSPELVTMTIEAAILAIRHPLATGDIAQAHTSWLWLMNALGENYASRINRPSPDNTGAANAAINSLIAISQLIPDNPENAPAKRLVDALVDFVVEAPTGKRTHALFHGKGWAGTFDKGSLRQQHIIGNALACVWLLQKVGHRRPDRFVTETLNAAGYEVVRSTLTGWKQRIGRWEIATVVRDDVIAKFEAAGVVSAIDALAKAEAIIKEELKLSVATTP